MFPSILNVRVVFLVLLFSSTLLTLANGEDANLQILIRRDREPGGIAHVVALIEEGKDYSRDQFGRTELYRAASGRDLKRLQQLIDQGANVNTTDKDGRSALLEAVGSLEPRAVEMLLAAGAKPDDGALGQAGWLGKIEAVKLMLAAGARPSAGIVEASLGGHVEIVKLLLAKGADVNAISRNGSTALHAAAGQGGLPTAQLLLANGAKLDAVNNEGHTPLHRAMLGSNDLRLVQALVQAGAKLDTPDNAGVTPVRLAANRGAKAIYQWLLASNGGNEPIAKRPAGNRTPEAAKSTKELIEALSSKPRENRMPAQRELVLRGKVVVPEVLLSVESGTSIEHFYELFWSMGPTADAARPKLVALLADKKQVFVAAMTLERMKPGSVNELPLESRQNAAATLYAAIVEAENPEVVGFHYYYLADLGEISAPHFVRLLRSDNARCRRAAAGSLASARFSDKEITAELLKVFQEDQDPSVRAEAARALGGFGEASGAVKAALLSFIKEPPARGARPDLADRAARSLARFGPGIIDELLPLLTPLNAPQRKAALTAIHTIGAPAVPRLIELLAHKDSAVAISASVSLSRIRGPAVPALAEAVKTGNEQVVDHAASALWWIGPGAPGALPALFEVAGSKERSDAARVAAARAALKVDPAKSRKSEAILSAISALIRTLKTGSFKYQGWAAETLAGIGPPARDALPSLRKRLELPGPNVDTNGLVSNYVRDQARQAIAAIEKQEE